MKQLNFKLLPLLVAAGVSQSAVAGNWGAHWSFDRHGQDSSGRHHVTAFASGAGSFDLGRKEQALYFDMARIDSLSMQQVNLPVGISFWAIREAGGLEETIIAKRDKTSGAGFSVQLDSSDALVFTLKNDKGHTLQVKSTWRWQDISQWHHIVVSYNGSMQASGVQLFVDNQAQPLLAVQNTLTDSQTTSAPLVIGSDSFDGIAFSGSIDDVYVTEQSLNPANVDCLQALRDGCIAFDNETPPDVGQQGPRGFEGPKGPKGVPGPAGKTGDVGPVGLAGDKGLVGDRGPKGDKGPAGPVGATGKAGIAGLNGSNGRDGVNGLPGPQGPQGADGLQGDKGSRGDKGATGPQGDTGPQGLKGATGAKGLTGIKGFTGDTGPDGWQGPPGDDGATGAQGKKGDKGIKGNTGPEGYQGLPGIRGIRGVNGQDTPGDQGPQGDQGPYGDPGNPYYIQGHGCGSRYCDYYAQNELQSGGEPVPAGQSAPVGVVATKADFELALKKYREAKAALQKVDTPAEPGEQQ